MRLQNSHALSYIGQIYEAFVRNPRWFSDNQVVVAGDFNSNKIWDKERAVGNHSAVVEFLERHQVLSAYHRFFSEQQGDETRPTHYFWHRKERGFHIDYVFIPEPWIPAIKAIEVGEHADWSKFSDHVPVVVDVQDPDVVNKL